MSTNLWQINRVYERRGKHWNSPTRYEWRTVGVIRAADRKDAMAKAQSITGATREYLHSTQK